MQDPIRVVEKARDDYESNFSDGVPAEACVVDILRARAVCVLPQDLLEMQIQLLAGLEVPLPEFGITVSFEVVRAKSKFGKQHEDPTHFRNMLNNLQMTVVTCTTDERITSRRVIFAELQLHQKDILHFNDQNRARQGTVTETV